MAHFFLPTHPHKTEAASRGALYALLIRPGVPVKIGLRSQGWRDGGLDLRAFRYGTWVSSSPSAPVKITQTAWRGDAPGGETLQVYSVTGLKNNDTLVAWRSADNRPSTTELPVYELRNTPSGMMREATSWYGIQGPFRNEAICSLAVPYLALKHATQGGMTELNDANVGGPLSSVHGLSVHTTAGRDDRSPYIMARWGCVETWNSGGHGASAHFGIAGDGTLVQFVPTSFVAHAQYSPGNEHWISVEVDNNGKDPMKAPQLESVRKLFGWVCDTYGVPRQLATGCLFPKASHFDKLTAEVCARAKAATTTDPYEACMSRGLSCHWWLEANKTGNSHACPGSGILNQMDAVARG